MSWNINLEQDWLRFDNSGATSSYYGYNRDPSSSDTSNTWSIRQIAGTGPISAYWNNNSALSYEVSWANRTAYFATPTAISSFTATASGGFGPSIQSTPTATATAVYSITFNWTGSTGSSRYYFSALKGNTPIMNFSDGGSNVFNPNQNTFVKQLINVNSITIANCPSGFTYSATIYANNGFGTSSTASVTISL